MNPGPTLARRLLLCALSAGLVVFSFPNFLDKTLTPVTAFLGWVDLIPLFLALRDCRPRQGVLVGLVFGMVQFGGILYWIAFLEEAKYLSGLAWFVLVFYLSLYMGAFGWAYCFLVERTKWGGVWLAPFLWVALEYVRGSWPWGGFNWGEIGYSQAPYPAVLTMTTVAGVYGLTFAMVWFNASLATALGEWMNSRNGNTSFLSNRSGRYLIGLPLILLSSAVLWGSHVVNSTAMKKVGSVVLLQPSIDQSVKWSKNNEEATYARISRLVLQYSQPRPDLFVWPETAAPDFLLTSPGPLQTVAGIVRKSRTAQLVGCLDMVRRPGKPTAYYNGAVHFNPDGNPAGVYHKRHLVPFGEFVPFQKYLTFLGPVVGDLGNFDFGSEYQKFQAGGFSYTPMICYEVIFPGDVQKAFRTGADALVNISNDAWYGRTASAYQHVMMAVVRSAEERKPLLRSANTGISMATDPFGRILVSTRLFEETAVRADVLTLVSGQTLYGRWGNWLPRLCWVVVILIGFMAFLKPKASEVEIV